MDLKPICSWVLGSHWPPVLSIPAVKSACWDLRGGGWEDSVVTWPFCLAGLPVYLRFADQLEFVFLSLSGLKDHIKLQSLQWQDCPKPIIGLYVHILENRNMLE